MAPGSGDPLRLNNLGVAYMNQRRFDEAQKLFEQAMAADANLHVARLNLGISLLSQLRLDEARQALEGVAEKLPREPAVWYNLGLVHRNLSDPEQALAQFIRAGELAPDDADAQYLAGTQLSQLQRYDEAIAAFERALRLNPFHASARFGLARAFQRKGDVPAAQKHLAEFQRLVREKLAAPMGPAYGDEGRLSLARDVRYAASVPPAIAVKFATVPAAESGLAMASREKLSPSFVCVFDFNNDSRPDLLVGTSEENPAVRLFRRDASKFTDVTAGFGLETFQPGPTVCAAGDYDNDGHTDVVFGATGGSRLFRNLGNGRFEDVTKPAGIGGPAFASSVTWVDFDHDGDLDLYGVQSSGGFVLWRNNGNGTFTDWTEAAGLPIKDAHDTAIGDFNNDRAIDLLVLRADAEPRLLLNPREGKFVQTTPWGAGDLKRASAVAVLDFDHDGWMDLAFAVQREVRLWRNVSGREFQKVASVPLPGLVPASLVAFDYDNDGWMDLGFVGAVEKSGAVRILRNRGPGGFEDATAGLGLDNFKFADVGRWPSMQAFDYDDDGDTDLVLAGVRGTVTLLRNDGGNRNNALRLSLKSVADNKSAIGTKVEVFAGTLYQKLEIQKPASNLLIGLGQEEQADIVRLLWPTGVPQDEINLASGRRHEVAELDRRGSSCPILFVWNGKEYEFVADMIGPGVIGHWVGPGERSVADPTEYLKVSGSSVQPRNGLLSFHFLEPMEETVYLDQVRLLAIDHPADVEVYPNERFASAPPFPEFRVIASRAARLPAGAWDNQGRDVLLRIARRDRKYVTEFDSLTFTGFAKLHWLELDLGPWDAQRPLHLLLDGYTDYFTATSMYAADQAGVKVIVPYVEALDAQGRWVRVVDDMGFPAGFSRTMVADLSGKLPVGTRRIRIVTNLKIYWDRVRIDATPETADIRVTEVPLASAALDFLGYPREVRGLPSSDTWFSYDSVSQTGPYARAAGNFTRFGDVRELLRASDERYAVFGTAEGVQLDFDPRRLPALPKGWARDYFFFADGFEKDMDFYAAHAFTVEPLPRQTLLPYPYPEGQAYPSDPESLRYQLEYNTRPSSGRLPPSLRYQYTQPR